MIEDYWICEEYCPVDFTIFQPGSSKALAISSGESWKPSAISKLDPHVMQISQFSVAPSGMVAIDLVLCIPQTVVTKGAKIAGPKISSFCYCRFESLRSTRWGQASDEICTSSRDRFKAWPGPKWRTERNKHWHEKDRSGQGGFKKENKQGTNFFEVPIFLVHVTEDSCVISLFLAEAFVQNQPCAPCLAITCWKPWPWDSVGSTLC